MRFVFFLLVSLRKPSFVTCDLCKFAIRYVDNELKTRGVEVCKPINVFSSWRPCVAVCVNSTHPDWRLCRTRSKTHLKKSVTRFLHHWKLRWHVLSFLVTLPCLTIPKYLSNSLGIEIFLNHVFRVFSVSRTSINSLTILRGYFLRFHHMLCVRCVSFNRFSLFSLQCNALVKKYGDLLMNIIIGQLTPDEVCAVRLVVFV